MIEKKARCCQCGRTAHSIKLGRFDSLKIQGIRMAPMRSTNASAPPLPFEIPLHIGAIEWWPSR